MAKNSQPSHRAEAVKDKYDAKDDAGQDLYDDQKYVLDRRLKKTLTKMSGSFVKPLTSSQVRQIITNESEIAQMKERMEDFDKELERLLERKYFET